MHFTMYKGVYFGLFSSWKPFFVGQGGKKMKKVVSVILCLGMLFTLCVNSVFAQDEMQTSYEKVISYYEENVDTLYYLDEVIALANAGVDVSKFNVAGAYDMNQNFKANIESDVFPLSEYAKF